MPDGDTASLEPSSGVGQEVWAAISVIFCVSVIMVFFFILCCAYRRHRRIHDTPIITESFELAHERSFVNFQLSQQTKAQTQTDVSVSQTETTTANL